MYEPSRSVCIDLQHVVPAHLKHLATLPARFP
jgi:hypothetical protein